MSIFASEEGSTWRIEKVFAVGQLSRSNGKIISRKEEQVIIYIKIQSGILGRLQIAAF